METGNWVRLGAIVAMVLASIYVLLPTVVRIVEGPQAELAAQAASIETPTQRAGTELVRVYEAPGGDAAAAAEVVEERLQLAKIAFEAVRATPEGRVEVVLKPGARDADVQALATVAGDTKVWPFASVLPGVDPSQPRDAWWAQAAALSRQAPPAGAAMAEQLGIPDVARVEAGLELHVVPTTNTVPVEVPRAIFVTVDGVLRGVGLANDRAVTPPGAVVPATAFDFHPLDDADRSAAGGERPTDLEVVLQSGPLPAGKALAPVATEASRVEQPKIEASAAEPWMDVPDWFVALLPNTPMNLGLDLQGGIDLTLQVELDEAVLSQAARDANFVRDQTKAENLAVDWARRATSVPVLRIATGMPLADLQAWMAEKLPTYEYDATVQEDGATVHQFRMREEDQQRVGDAAVEQVLETLRKRIDATGVKERNVVRKGSGRIGVQLPGMVDLNAAVAALGTTAVLEFRLVDEEFGDAELERILRAAQEQMPPEQYANDNLLNAWLHETGRLPEERLVLWEYVDTPETEPTRANAVPLVADVVLTGSDINNAGVAWDQNQQPYVSLEFKSRGAQEFCRVTTDNVGKRFAIILDNQVQSTPSIRERICGGRASIEMGASMDAVQEANNLALVLRTGSLNAPVTIGEVRTVGSTLGQDAIRAGTLATLIGSIFVFVYMGLMYRWSGLLADLTLACNVLVMLAILALFGATLTLPGIAGIALTVGMAVDASILIYERIREELKLGVNARKAVDAGFEKAFSAIMDANVTTAIAGIVLFSYGTGPIKGFAVTLCIGIITTLITALFVNRSLMELATRRSDARLSI